MKRALTEKEAFDKIVVAAEALRAEIEAKATVVLIATTKAPEESPS